MDEVGSNWQSVYARGIFELVLVEGGAFGDRFSLSVTARLMNITIMITIGATQNGIWGKYTSSPAVATQTIMDKINTIELSCGFFMYFSVLTRFHPSHAHFMRSLSNQQKFEIV
jgi:hypothetical protein